jgi:DNA-binding FadR family transcriptional regulator
MTEIASKGTTFWEEDVAFHKAVFSLTGNRLLARLLDVFWEVLAHQRDQEAFTDHDPIRNARRHEELLRALEEKDVTLARKLIVQHMDTTRERLRRVETPSMHRALADMTEDNHDAADQDRTLR